MALQTQQDSLVWHSLLTLKNAVGPPFYGPKPPPILLEALLKNHKSTDIFSSVDLRLPPPAPSRPPQNVEFNIDWLPRSRAGYTDTELRTLALQQLDSYPTFTPVFTDASKDSTGTGLAVFFPNTPQSYSQRVQPEACITTAELRAILLAFLLSKETTTPLLVVSDSHTALACIQTPPQITGVFQTIWSLAKKFPRVVFLWVPSHVGIAGNEKADALAKESCSRPLVEPIPIPLADAVNAFKSKLIGSWTTAWTQGDTGRVLFSVKPEPGPWKHSQLPKSSSSVLSSLRCGRARLDAYLLRVGRSDTDLCANCLVPEDATHLFLQCNLYDDQRTRLHGSLRALGAPLTLRSILGGSDVPTPQNDEILKATFTFIDSTVGRRRIVRGILPPSEP